MRALRLHITTLLLGVTLGVLVLTFVVSTKPSETKDIQRNTDFIALAEEAVALCAEDEYRPSCYDRELPKLMDEGYSMEEVFMITREVQHRDDSYQYCHVLGHYLSQKETAKDPSKWKDVFARAPRGICSNGAIHGAFQERFNAEALPNASKEELKAELIGICDARENWSPTGLERGSCLHALGHLTMYATGGDIDKSLALCDELVPTPHGYKGSLQLCYDGAYMQIFQPLEPEDEALVAHYGIDTFSEARDFCSQYEEEKLGSCTSESWSISDGAINDPVHITSICDPLRSSGSQQMARCINNVFYISAAQLNLNVDDIYNFCSQVPDPYHHVCFKSATSRLIEVDYENIPKSVAVCNRAEAAGAKESCFNELVNMSDFTFDRGSKEFSELCATMPEPYRSQCYAKRST